MDWLEQNLDAYRVVAEMLGLLRAELHAILVRLHGEDWHRKGMPQEVFDRLVAAKEKERSIDWYESEYQEIIDYADFIDFLRIIEHNLDAFPHLVKLAPNGQLLHVRFLELEVMRTKLGRAREISEPELAFLSTFHLRLRDALAHAPRATAGGSGSSADSTPDGVTGSQPTAPASAAEEVQFESTDTASGEDLRQAPAPVPPPSSTDPAPDAASPAATTPPAAAAPRPRQSAIDEAIEHNDSRSILRELYTEITATADALWSEEPLAPPAVWSKVAVSDWYQTNISRLGLKPLSDFYEIIAGVTERARGGLSRNQLQQHLKESNFAQILLALRDMFQRNNL